MSHVLILEYCGAQTKIEVERPELTQALAFVYASFIKEGPSLDFDISEADYRGPWRGEVDGESFDFSELIHAVVLVEDTIADRLMTPQNFDIQIHASSLRDGDHSVFLAGKSGSGKTTSSLEWTRRGLTYMGDEFLNLKDGKVYPFPRAAVRKYDGPVPPGARMQIPSEKYFRNYSLPDNRASLEPLDLHRISLIFPSQAKGDPISASPVGTGEACSRLLTSIFRIEGRLPELWPHAARLADKSQSYEFVMNDVSEDLDLLLDLMAKS